MFSAAGAAGAVTADAAGAGALAAAADDAGGVDWHALSAATTAMAAIARSEAGQRWRSEEDWVMSNIVRKKYKLAACHAPRLSTRGCTPWWQEGSHAHTAYIGVPAR